MDEIGQPSSTLDIPQGVRLRFAVGLRVHAPYTAWAIAQIRADGWPIRRVFTRLPLLLSVSVTTALAVTLLMHGSLTHVAYPLVIFPIVHVLIGAVFAAYRSEWLRQGAIAYQLRTRRRGGR